MSRNRDMQRCSSLKGTGLKLITRHPVILDGEQGRAVEVRRGMAVVSMEGHEVGTVAAVAVYPRNPQAVCLILSHLPAYPGYQSIPIEWVERVEAEVVFLKVSAAVVQALPDWHAV